MNFIAEFEYGFVVNAQEKNNGVHWEVRDVETGEESIHAKINNKGVLTANRGETERTEIEVIAISDSFGTSASARVTIVPEISKIGAEPAEITLYTGTEEQQTIKVTHEPEAAPAPVLTWTAGGKNIEIMDHGDGSATVRPLSAGKTSITIKEQGGKNTRVNVTVREPVQEIQLETKGNIVPGGTVYVNAKVLPNNATDKTLQWAIDVDESIATIGNNGQVKISKDAEQGTQITITCTAEGTSEPIRATLVITVEE